MTTSASEMVERAVSVAPASDARPAPTADGIARTFDLPGFGPRAFRFPTLFADSFAVAAVFPCDLAAARRELGRADLRPLAIAPGKSCVVVTAYRHRVVSEMDPYSELVALVPARKRGSIVPPLVPLWLAAPLPAFGHVPLAMPVDSALNVARGVGIWGLPKYLAGVKVESERGVASVRVIEGGRVALSFAAPMAGRRRSFDVRFRLWCAEGSTCATQRGEALVRRGPFGESVLTGIGVDPSTRLGGMLNRLGASKRALEARIFDHLEMYLDLPVGGSAPGWEDT